MKIIAFYSMKGGVGKTAAAVNIAYLAAQNGKPALLCDLDPQGSATFYFRIRAGGKHSSKTLIKGGKKIDKNIKETDYEGLDLLPSDMSYRNLDLFLDDVKKSHKQLKNVLSPLKKEYEYVFLDCPPNITLLSENIFFAADTILIPFIPTTLSHLTYQKLLDFFDEIKVKKSVLKPFFSMVEKRKCMHRDLMEELGTKKRFLETVIPYCSDVEKMGLHRKPVCDFRPSSPASKAFVDLWAEMSEVI